MPGPAPNPYARRRNARPDWVKLPAIGYDGKIPAWPLVPGAGDQERDLWESLWRTPQATMWASGGHSRVVARYVRVVVMSEDPENPNAALLGEVRQLEDRLGLSPMAMKRLQWEVEEGSSQPKLAEVSSIDRFANL